MAFSAHSLRNTGHAALLTGDVTARGPTPASPRDTERETRPRTRTPVRHGQMASVRQSSGHTLLQALAHTRPRVGMTLKRGLWMGAVGEEAGGGQKGAFQWLTGSGD